MALFVQAMPYDEAGGYRFNPFDPTKVWPHADHPLVENAHMLPVNRPLPEVEARMNHHVFDGAMNYEVKSGPTYVPNSEGRGHAVHRGPVSEGWEADGTLVRQAYTLHAEDDDWTLAGMLVRDVFDDAQRDRFVETVAGALGGVREDVLERAFAYWGTVDAEIGKRIEERVRAGAGDPIPGAADEEKSALREPLTESAHR